MMQFSRNNINRKFTCRLSNFLLIGGLIIVISPIYVFLHKIMINTPLTFKDFIMSITCEVIGFFLITFKLEISPTGIRAINLIKFFGIIIKKWEHYEFRWDNSIILLYFGWPIWGISVQEKGSTASNFLISSITIHKYREASKVLYIYAKGKAEFIDDETVKYLEELSPLNKNELHRK